MIINIPNSITFARLIIAVVGFVFMILNEWMIAGILISVAVLLDVLDGRVARRLSQVTSQGVFLDVMADKIVIISTFLIVGVGINIYFFYLGILMLIREYTIDTMRSIAASKHTVISADKFSKIKGVMFMIAMLGMIWNKVFLENNEKSQLALILLASLAMLIAYITLIRFFNKYKNILLS